MSAGDEYLRCRNCANIMPFDGVALDETCHMCGGEYEAIHEDRPWGEYPERMLRAMAGELAPMYAALPELDEDEQSIYERMADELHAQWPQIAANWRAHVAGARSSGYPAATRVNEEEVMSRNPYRLMGREERAMGDALMAPLAGYQDRGMGPGLLGADIHDIARRHYKAGYGEAEREARVKLDEATERLGDAWDEGHDAGFMERSRSLANDFRVRIIEAHFVLQQIERGPKSRAFESLPQLRAQVNDLIAFAQSMTAETPESEAMHGARAKVAREGGTSQTVHGE